jgi:hypothetical protein
VPFETDLEQWEAGQRRLADAPPHERAGLERVSLAI